jgi:hypothetical protein
MESALNGRTPLRRGQISLGKQHLYPVNVTNAFFNGFTSDITHPPKKKQKVTVEYVCEMRVKMNKCTSNRVNLGLKSGEYCRMCYQKQVSTELVKAKGRRQRCRTSRLGCAICTEPI